MIALLYVVVLKTFDTFRCSNTANEVTDERRAFSNVASTG